MNKTRASALAAVVATALGGVYAAAAAITGWQPSLGWLFQAILHIGELLAVVALARSGAAGSSRVARLGLGAAILGQAVLAAAEVVWPNSPDLGNILFGVAPILTGAGLIAAGVGVLRSAVWTGWTRLVPLILGAYTFLALMPVLIGSGGPPAPAALWAIAGWDLLWLTLAGSVLTHPHVPAVKDRAHTTITVR